MWQYLPKTKHVDLNCKQYVVVVSDLIFSFHLKMAKGSVIELIAVKVFVTQGYVDLWEFDVTIEVIDKEMIANFL